MDADSKGRCDNIRGEALNTLEKLQKVKDKTRPSIHSVGIDGYEDDWSPRRKFMGRVLSAGTFDSVLCAVILGNMALLVIETDQRAAEGDAEEWIKIVNYCLMIVYFVEICCRIYVYRYAYFLDHTHWADIIIVSLDILGETISLALDDNNDMPSVVCIRLFKICRLGRSHKALEYFPELRVMVVGLVGALKAIFWGMILLFMALLTWSILAVQIIHPLNKRIADAGVYVEQSCDRCPRAFNSVAASLLTFTQHIVAGDSWGSVSVTIIEHYPATYVFFFLVLVSVGMAILNTILAVVIDSAAAARKETDHQIVQMRDQEFRKASETLLAVCQELDADASGTLSVEELQDGYHTNVEFADAMALLDISVDDMNTVFSMMDTDNSGDVRYDEFVKEIYKIKKADSHTLLVFIKHFVVDLRQKFEKEMHSLVERAGIGHHNGALTSSSMKENSLAESGSVTLLESISRAVANLEANTAALHATMIGALRYTSNAALMNNAELALPSKSRLSHEARLRMKA